MGKHWCRGALSVRGSLVPPGLVSPMGKPQIGHPPSAVVRVRLMCSASLASLVAHSLSLISRLQQVALVFVSGHAYVDGNLGTRVAAPMVVAVAVHTVAAVHAVVAAHTVVAVHMAAAVNVAVAEASAAAAAAASSAVVHTVVIVMGSGLFDRSDLQMHHLHIREFSLSSSLFATPGCLTWPRRVQCPPHHWLSKSR